MAEQLLHRAQVAGRFQHVAGERMAQQMRMDMLGNALLPCQRVHAQLHRARVDRCTGAATEDRAVRRHALLGAERAQRGNRVAADRHDAGLAALAEHAHFAAVEIQVDPAQADQFGQAQPAGIEQFQHGPVAQRQLAAAVGFDQRGGLVDIEHLRQGAAHLGAAHAEHRLAGQYALAIELAKQAAAGRQQTLQTFRRQPIFAGLAAMFAGDEGAHQVRVQRIERGQFVRLHETQQLGQVATVAGDGVRRGMPLVGETDQPVLDLLCGRHRRLRRGPASAPTRR